MSKKDRMLDYIVNNVDYLMSVSGYTAIPYSEFEWEVYLKVLENFWDDIEFEDIICLISTSIMGIGDSGILFTEKHMYSRCWGLFPQTFRYRLEDSQQIQFETFTEFHEGRMREIMQKLSEISRQEEKQISFWDILNAANEIVNIANNTLEAASEIQDQAIEEGNQAIANRIDSYAADDDMDYEEDAGEYDTDFEEGFYEVFSSFTKKLMGQIEGIDSEDADFEKMLRLLGAISDMLYMLQVSAEMVSAFDVDSVKEQSKWIEFWTALWCGQEDFYEIYSNEMFQDAVEQWEAIIGVTDAALDSVSDWSLSQILQDFIERCQKNADAFDEIDFEGLEEGVENLAEANSGIIEILGGEVGYIADLLANYGSE